MLRNEHYQKDITYITRLTRHVLILLGAWPPVNRERSTGEKAWKLLLNLLSYMLLYAVLLPGALFWSIERRARVRAQTIPLLFYCILTTGKYGNLLYRQELIKCCLRHVQEDWMNVANMYSRNMMLDSAKIGRRLVTLCAVFMYGSGLSFRSILPFAKGTIVTAQNVTIKPLPCAAYFYIFDIQMSPFYELVFAMQFVSGIVTYSITTGVCGLAAVFVMHACGQLNILMGLMRGLIEVQCQEKHEVNRKLAEMVEHQIRIRKLESIIFYYFLTALISFHRNFSFIRLVEDTLQQTCLIEILGCTFMVCILGYLIIKEWENSNSIAMCSYFITLTSMLINMFLFCYTGEQLSIQVERVASTSCDLDWYRLPDKKAREIVLVIMMSNLPIKVTAGKIMELSFKTYGDIIKTSLTYFNMLLNIAD